MLQIQRDSTTWKTQVKHRHFDEGPSLKTSKFYLYAFQCAAFWCTISKLALSRKMLLNSNNRANLAQFMLKVQSSKWKRSTDKLIKLIINFPFVIQNDWKRQTSQGYIIRILQHFATKLRNITNFVLLFQAVMKLLPRHI
jgi:hypothetical protein